jgi:HPr kinase/phosphorylase
LVADDSVHISLYPNNQLIGRAPELTQHYIELRGIGIVNIRDLFGNSAVLNETKISMVVKFVPWEDNQIYERLGIDEHVETIMGVDLPLSIIPVKPGRNLSVLVETEAINRRAKIYGQNAAKELDETLKNHMKGKE